MSTATVSAQGTVTAPGRRLSLQPIIAVLVLAGGVAMAIVMAETDPLLAPLWLLGMAAGFTLSRSRFCFASAFRDLFLFGSARTMKGILLGLSIATVGFAIVMYAKVPNPTFGFLPDQAHILPVGLSTVAGGLLFGIGMVLAGGCVSGSLYRMAEGYIGSWVSMLGVMIGLGALFLSWNFLWDLQISKEPAIWLPSVFNLGYGGAVALTLLGIAAVFLLVTWWEARTGLSMPDTGKKKTEPDDSFSGQLKGLWSKVFVHGWSAAVGGAVLGGIVVFMYMVHMPWGVTGEIGRWTLAAMDTAGIGAPVFKGLSDLGGCSAQTSQPGLFNHTFAITVGLIPGALVAALFSREFKVRLPKSPTRYVQSLGGGVLMGYGAGLAVGCTIGSFFNAIPSLAVSGWVFGLALAGGAFIGTQAIRRIG